MAKSADELKADIRKKEERMRNSPTCPYHNVRLITDISNVADVLSGEKSFTAYCPEVPCDYTTTVNVEKSLFGEYKLRALNVK